jgi:hypothetical protein
LNNFENDVYLDGNNDDEDENDAFDFDLVAQELANTGSAQSEKELG